MFLLAEATLKKSVFPVQQVAEIMATRAATISFFFVGKRRTEMFGEKKEEKNRKL